MSVVTRSLIGLAIAERRRHQRVEVLLSGRFMRSDRREFDCVTIDMSPGGVALASEAAVEPGGRIVVYLDHLGRLEGSVARTFFGGFAIRMKLSPAKRNKLADQLTWLANRALVGMPEDRRHERIEPRNTRTRRSGSRIGRRVRRQTDRRLAVRRGGRGRTLAPRSGSASQSARLRPWSCGCSTTASLSNSRARSPPRHSARTLSCDLGRPPGRI